MKSKILRISAILLIISAIALFLYPNISKLIMKEKNIEIIDRFDRISEEQQENGYDQDVEDSFVDTEGYLVDENGELLSDYPAAPNYDLDSLYADSIRYNELLREHQDLNCDLSQAVLDLSDYYIYDGVYGYITAPTIGMYLPIYLGADDSNMASGAAHLNNTSLPLGGTDTNAVFAGHTGYFGRTVFDYLPSLDIGDAVSVTTFFDTFEYRVVSAKEIEDTDIEDIYIRKGKDLITLITCADMGESRFEVVCERL